MAVIASIAPATLDPISHTLHLSILCPTPSFPPDKLYSHMRSARTPVSTHSKRSHAEQARSEEAKDDPEGDVRDAAGVDPYVVVVGLKCQFVCTYAHVWAGRGRGWVGPVRSSSSRGTECAVVCGASHGNEWERVGTSLSAPQGQTTPTPTPTPTQLPFSHIQP